VKIAVIGGTGLVGSKLASALRTHGDQVVAASRNTGVDIITGKGLHHALTDAQVVVDVSNSPSLEDAAAMAFFVNSTRNLLAAAVTAGVRHYIALSVVGAERLVESGYLRAKVAQERLIRNSSVPYTVLKATQFFEFIDGIITSSTQGGVVRLPPVLAQPIASDDVVALLAEIALGAPANDILEVAGPEAIRLDELARVVLSAHETPRQIITDVHARYFGAEVDDQSLIPGPNSRIGSTLISDWLRQMIPAG
jgi:uncharacterized protein YbjT (DUF2867 family)